MNTEYSFAAQYSNSECQNDIHDSNVLFFYLNLIYESTDKILSYLAANRVSLIVCLICLFVILVWYKIYWCTHKKTSGIYRGRLCTITLRPKDRNRDVGQNFLDVGYDHIPPGLTRDGVVARATLSRQVGRKIPPPYPNGWFVVAESDKVKKRGVLSVVAFGQKLCVYRGTDGVARVVDAYCPHLGADLSAGGTVYDKCIECPFHKWRFDETGVCVKVPGEDNAPKGVSLKAWRSIERNMAIWVWYHAENTPPSYEIPVAELGNMSYRGTNEFFFEGHYQTHSENAADFAHLNVVHAPCSATSLADKYPFLKHVLGYHYWYGTWERGDRPHISRVNLNQDYKIFNCTVGHMEITTTLHGPGYNHMLIKTFAGPIVIIDTSTPLGPLTQNLVHRVFSPWWNAPLARAILKGEIEQIRRDTLIWKWMRVESSPAYTASDKQLRAFKQWFSQFYSENSVTFKDAIQNNTAW